MLQCGVAVWCCNVVLQCGVAVWCCSVVSQCGVAVWCYQQEQVRIPFLILHRAPWIVVYVALF